MKTVIQKLTDALSKKELVTDPDVMAAYTHDQAGFCKAGQPCAVVLARRVESVAATLRIASETKTPVVTRGAGTGLAGGANAIEGGIVLSVGKMDRILEIDPEARIARVEPGVLNADLDRQAREFGLMYAPDPSSRDISTIGGNVATNAGGACCLKYGVTGDHVAKLVAVLADGERIETGSLSIKNVAGLDLQRLLIGSEGTLAVIVEVVVRLMPVKPGFGSFVAFFPTLADAGAAIVQLQAMDNLSKLEIMDRNTVRAVESLLRMELDTDAAAMLIAQADTPDAESIVQRGTEICEKNHASFVATTLDEAEGKMFMQARYAALPALEKQGHYLLDDVAVPVPRIPELLELCAAVADKYDVLIGTFGHAGDGNLHPTLVYDAASETSTAAALRAFDDIVKGTLALDGTVSGEHGVGTLKRKYLADMVGARELALMQGIKTVFDPLGILNPGKGL